MNILEAIISGDHTDNSGNTRIQKTQYVVSTNLTDDRIFICNDCGMAWEKPISGVPKKSLHQNVLVFCKGNPKEVFA